MAATCNLAFTLVSAGLSNNPIVMADAIEVSTIEGAAFTGQTYGYRAIASSTDLAAGEALPLGDVDTVELIAVKAVSQAMDVDTTWVSSFNAEITIPEGSWAIFKPSDTVYIRNNSSDTAGAYEYIVIGDV